MKLSEMPTTTASRYVEHSVVGYVKLHAMALECVLGWTNTRTVVSTQQ